MSEKIIYLDMDGVCCDFVGQVVAHMDYKVDIDNWPSGEYEVSKVIGMPEGEFKTWIEGFGEDWWRSMPEYPWFKKMYEELSKIARVIFLTTPMPHPRSVSGKLMWLQDRFGNGFREYAFCKYKSLFAKPNTVLVDDYEKNIEEFEKNGGLSVLFPRPWNCMGDGFMGDPGEFAVKEVKFELDI